MTKPAADSRQATARLNWQMGSWDKLAELQVESPQKGSMSRDQVELLLYRMQGLFVSGAVDEGRKLARTLSEAGVSRRSLIAALVSGAQSNVARAYLANGQRELAKSRIAAAVALNPEAGDQTSVESLRYENESRRLATQQSGGADVTTVADEYVFEHLSQIAPQNPFVTIALAERAQWKKDFPAAIRHWQTLARIHGDAMPQPYYERLAAAYAAQSGFPQATKEEEARRGSFEKHQALKIAHQVLKPKLYLEVGVESGRSIRLATGKAIGIDPMPMLNAPLPATATIFEMSSDSFFEDEAWKYLDDAPDLVFIDGMHLFEFALRDFINVERFSGPNTIVVIDDVFPNHPAQALRDRRTRAWTGDVWKVHDVLLKYRPDLQLIEADALPTGLLLISGLDRKNRVLSDSYDAIISEYVPIDDVPQYYIEREGVVARSIESFKDSLLQLLK